MTVSTDQLVSPKKARQARWPRRAALLALVAAVAVGLFWTPISQLQLRRSLQQRDYESAGRWLSRAGWLSGESPEQSFWSARLQRKLLRSERAVAELNRAEQLGFDAQKCRNERLLIVAQTGQIAGIVSELQAWMVDSGDDGAEICEALANGLLINGATDDATAVIHAWKQDYPADPQAWQTWGRWLESQQLTEPAEAEYRKALTVRPDFAPALYALGRLYLNQSHMDEAREYFTRSAAAIEANSAPRIGLARCLHLMGEADSARRILEDVISLGDDRVEFSFVLVQDPDTTLPAKRLLGEILTGFGEFAAAQPLLEDALQREPRDPTLRYQEAQCLQGLGRDAEANALFQEVAEDRAAIAEADRLVDEIRQHPGQPQVDLRFRVGELFWKHDSSRKAEYWLRNTLVYDPSHAGAHRILADYYDLHSRHDPHLKSVAEHHRLMSANGPERKTSS